MNIFENVQPRVAEEEFLELVSTDFMKVERIVSAGHQSPDGFWYDQDWHEWVLVLSGRGVIEFEDGTLVQLGEGDYVNIPAHHKHRVKETSDRETTVWLAVHYK
jgi:cupin 2 domain-containing protein